MSLCLSVPMFVIIFLYSYDICCLHIQPPKIICKYELPRAMEEAIVMLKILNLVGGCKYKIYNT